MSPYHYCSELLYRNYGVPFYIFNSQIVCFILFLKTTNKQKNKTNKQKSKANPWTRKVKEATIKNMVAYRVHMKSGTQ